MGLWYYLYEYKVQTFLSLFTPIRKSGTLPLWFSFSTKRYLHFDSHWLIILSALVDMYFSHVVLNNFSYLQAPPAGLLVLKV